MTQLKLDLQDGRESQVDRLRRILAGVPKVATAATFFTEEAYERACALAQRDVAGEAGRAAAALISANKKKSSCATVGSLEASGPAGACRKWESR